MVTSVFRLAYSTLNWLLSHIVSVFGYELLMIASKKRSAGKSASLNLNIGAGDYIIDGFQSLDFYSEHYYPSKKKFSKKRVHYDIRNDPIPYEANTVDNIYVSHVIEHIEDAYIERFISEAKRVLKLGGVLRIACPDAKFLYQVSQFKNDYWSWRDSTLANKKNYDVNWDNLSQLDYLIREVSTPRFRFNRNRIQNLVLQPSDIAKLSYQNFVDFLHPALSFRADSPGDHINLWDVDRLSALGTASGFSHVLESKQFGSVSSEMQGLNFDRTAPHMTLYVEMIK